MGPCQLLVVILGCEPHYERLEGKLHAGVGQDDSAGHFLVLDEPQSSPIAVAIRDSWNCDGEVVFFVFKKWLEIQSI
jgi:hypothetical protein